MYVWLACPASRALQMPLPTGMRSPRAIRVIGGSSSWMDGRDLAESSAQSIGHYEIINSAEDHTLKSTMLVSPRWMVLASLPTLVCLLFGY